MWLDIGQYLIICHDLPAVSNKDKYLTSIFPTYYIFPSIEMENLFGKEASHDSTLFLTKLTVTSHFPVFHNISTDSSDWKKVL